MATAPFSMRLDEQIRTSLHKEAKLRDRPASYLAQRAIAEYLERQTRERHLLTERLAEAEAGVFVSEDKVLEWVDSWFTESETQKPEADIFPQS